MTEPGPTIAGQYIDFAKTLDAFRVELGPTERAVKAAIAACLSRGVLSDYLADHEKEVVSIMVTLYDEQEVMRNHIASEIRIARAKALAEGLAEGIEEGRAEGRTKGLAEGRAEGRATGLAEGRAEGRATGLAEGRAEGRATGLAEGVVAMCKEFGLSRAQTASKLAERLDIDTAEAEKLLAPIW